MKDAIIIRDTLFINAGAGTGKTYRLTHDLADLLTGGNDNNHNPQEVTIQPQEVIVTTFSKAAAAEIRERARQVLLAQGRTADATRLETASIGTIHSVAQRFINKYWYLIGACPNQQVLSDEDKIIYRNQSLATLLDDGEKLKGQRQAIDAFFKTFSPKKMENDITLPDPDFWANDLVKIVQKATYYHIDNLSVSKKKSIKEIKDRFAATMAADKIKIITDCVEAIFQIAEVWLKNYEDYKRKMGVIDYDDMEKGFFRLLTDDRCKEQIAQEIRSSYKLVMVDEFQDCNPMQLQIFSKISDIIKGNSVLPYNSIWVGDPNQAIYGFRGSDTELINRVKSKFTARYPDKTPEVGDFTGLSRDSLDKSYRSREELVDYANRLFTLRTDKGPFFEDYTVLKAPRGVDTRLGNPVQQWNFQRYAKGWNEWHVTFARHIKELVDDGTLQVLPKDEKETRPIRYKDIAILVKTNADLKAIVDTLRQEGVPASAPERNILDRAEVQLALAILNLRHTVADNEGEKRLVSRPHEVATLLRLWCDMSTEEVLSERVDHVNEPDWASLHPELKPIFVALDDCKDLPLDEKLAAIILELDLYDKVKKWGQADVRRQNLNTLQRVAVQFVERCTRMGIHASEKEFDRYIHQVEIKSEVDRTSDSVTVSTYHGSKGLEWPMVILSSLEKDPFTKFIQHEYYGVHEMINGDSEAIIGDYFIHYVPQIGKSKDDDLPAEADLSASPVCQIARERIIGEMKRLFYVGLTRARDYVVYSCAPTITQDNPKGAVRWAIDFTWLDKIGLKESDLQAVVELFPPLIPNVLKEPKEPKRPKKDTPTYLKKKAEYDADLRAYQESVRAHDDAKSEEDRIAKERKKGRPYELRDIAELAENSLSAKYRHPSVDSEKSAEPEKREFQMELLPGVVPVGLTTTDAEGNDIMKYRHAVLGTCIHNLYAVSPWKGESLTEEEMGRYRTVAMDIVKEYRLEDVIADVEPLITNHLRLMEWLKGRYGAPIDIVTEYPFSYPYGDGDQQVVAGEIDMVYRTPEVDVIVDYKTHIGDRSILGSPNEEGKFAVHFVSSKYEPQLRIYRDIWQRAYPDHKVVTYLYYNVLGGVIEV